MSCTVCFHGYCFWYNSEIRKPFSIRYDGFLMEMKVKQACKVHPERFFIAVYYLQTKEVVSPHFVSINCSSGKLLLCFRWENGRLYHSFTQTLDTGKSFHVFFNTLIFMFTISLALLISLLNINFACRGHMSHINCVCFIFTVISKLCDVVHVSYRYYSLTKL